MGSVYSVCYPSLCSFINNDKRMKKVDLTKPKAIKIPDWIEVYRHNTFDMVVYSWNRLYFKKKNEEYGHDERIEFGTFAGSAISSDKLTHFIPHEGELEVGRCYVAKLGDSNEIGMYYVYSGRSANSDVFAFFTEKYHRIVFDLIHMPKGAEYLKPVTEQEAIDLGYDV